MGLNREFAEKRRGIGKHHVFLISMLIFGGVIGAIYFSSVYDGDFGGGVTGKVLKRGETNVINIDATLTKPNELKLKGNVGKVTLKIGSGIIYIGKEKMELGSSSIIIDNFNGNININNNFITTSGKASKIFVNGLPISGDTVMKISFENFDFNYLNLESFNMPILEYKTSGTVRLNDGKAIIKIEDEIISLEDFTGNLEVKGDTMKLSGVVEKSNLGFIDVRGSVIPKVEVVDSVEE